MFDKKEKKIISGSLETKHSAAVVSYVTEWSARVQEFFLHKQNVALDKNENNTPQSSSCKAISENRKWDNAAINK